MATVKVGIHVVDKYGDGELSYRMFWCGSKDERIQMWFGESMTYLGEYGGIPNDDRVTKSGRCWATVTIVGTFDYWGEYDEQIFVKDVKWIKRK